MPIYVCLYISPIYYSKVLRYEDGNQLCGFSIWMLRLVLWKLELSSCILYHVPSASLRIRSLMGSILNSCCLWSMGQIVGQCSFAIHLTALFCITCSLLIWVLELMFSGMIGYVSRGRINVLCSLIFSFLFKFLNLLSFVSSAFALFVMFSICLT